MANLSIPTADEIADLVIERLRAQLMPEILTAIDNKTFSVTQPEKPWMNSQEAQALLACKFTKLDMLMKSGLLPFRKLGRTLMFKREDVLNLLENTGQKQN